MEGSGRVPETPPGVFSGSSVGVGLTGALGADGGGALTSPLVGRGEGRCILSACVGGVASEAGLVSRAGREDAGSLPVLFLRSSLSSSFRSSLFLSLSRSGRSGFGRGTGTASLGFVDSTGGVWTGGTGAGTGGTSGIGTGTSGAGTGGSTVTAGGTPGIGTAGTAGARTGGSTGIGGGTPGTGTGSLGGTGFSSMGAGAGEGGSVV